MSWWSSTPSIDEQVEKATSESLPSGESDLALNLEICDLIRSKTVPAKDAMRSLKRRLLNRNPNVQLAALQLTDVCIKNGGSHFLVEIASREFVDPLMAVVRNDDANPEVKQRVLQLLQQWSVAFAGQLQLQQVENAVTQLKSEGISFPSASHDNAAVTSTFIDTKAPPEWIDSDVCMESGVAFSFLNRKHHCRNCGGVFTQACCQNYITLPHFGINVPVRVCNGCFKNLKKGKSDAPIHKTVPAVAPTSGSGPGAAPIPDDEDDIQKAIRLSLQEQESYKPPPPAATSSNDDDEDMKAAIAASLRDMENERQTGQTAAPAGGMYSASTTVTAPSLTDLTATEESNINLLSLLVERLKGEPQGTILREPKIQELYDTVGNLRPKLARTMGETISKYDSLVDMHAKMTTVIRYYDALLEEKLNQAYTNRQSGGYAPQPHLAHQMTGQVTGQPSHMGYQHTGQAPYLTGQMTGQAPYLTGQTTGQAPYLNSQATGQAPYLTGQPTGHLANHYTGSAPSAPQYGGHPPAQNAYNNVPSYPYSSAPGGYDYASSPSAPSAPGGPSAPSAPVQPKEESAPLIEL
ncbi:Vacuolar protein sorting-associated protein 27 [Yarrowia sp. C11]|nr:Vacuolar protein sorting-associated protein 27 [Yarrowia sp. C11]KAG5363954.1 Vacuolar protein sorting-associated protein 27 [Yarrowia sp. E02]